MSPFRLIFSLCMLWAVENTITADAECLNDNYFHVKGKPKLTCQYIRKDEERRQQKCKLADVRDACPQTCGLCCEDDTAYELNDDGNKLRKCLWLSKKKKRQRQYCKTFNSGRMVKDACPSACGKCLPPVPVNSCVDNSSYRRAHDETKSCDWIGRRQDRRERMCNIEEIRSNCPLACRTCCADDESFIIETNNGKEKKCRWLQNDYSKRKRYCANLNNGALVENRCGVSCGRCTPDGTVGTSPPTARPTLSPTNNPTFSPTTSPTFAPSKSPITFPTISENCRLSVKLQFPTMDQSLYGYHNDDFKIEKENGPGVCGLDKYYNQTDWCFHSGDAFVWKDKDEETTFDKSRVETAIIPSAAGNVFTITIQHYFVYYEYNYEQYYNDHTMAGALTLAVNGEDLGVEFHHHVNEDVDTHIQGVDKMEVNPDYTDMLVVRVSCDDSCICVAEDD